MRTGRETGVATLNIAPRASARVPPGRGSQEAGTGLAKGQREEESGMKSGGIPYYQDRLVVRFRFADGARASQGKRLPKRLQGILSAQEMRAYVTKGTVEAVRVIQGARCLGLAEAKILLDQVRGGMYAQGRGL